MSVAKPEMDETGKDVEGRRGWAFTINNYTEEDLQCVDRLAEKSLYCVIGYEIAPETGTPHLQGYVYFKSARSFKSVKKVLPRAWIQAAYANAQKNRDYCTKGGNSKSWGTCPQQGSRNDLKEIAQAVKDGKSFREIVDIATNYQSLKTAQLLLPYYEPQRSKPPEVFWYHGPSGSGKSRKAFEDLPDAYVAGDMGKWFDGYDAHKDVVIDDIREDTFTFKTLLRMFDRYPYRVECKGGSRQFLAERIIVTCPKRPEELFRWENEEMKQLLRRISKIQLFK